MYRALTVLDTGARVVGKQAQPLTSWSFSLLITVPLPKAKPFHLKLTHQDAITLQPACCWHTAVSFSHSSILICRPWRLVHSVLFLNVLQSSRKNKYLCEWQWPLNSEGFHLYCVTQFHGKTTDLICSSSEILNANIFSDNFSLLVIQNLTAVIPALQPHWDLQFYGLYSQKFIFLLLVSLPSRHACSSSPKLLLCLYCSHICQVNF